MPEELSQYQMDRIDFVHNTCYRFICELAEEDPDRTDIAWNMEWIGELSDLAQEIICHRLGLMTEMEFKPYVPIPNDRPHEVILELRSGVIEELKRPLGIEVIIHDYDVDGTEDDLITDDDGDHYREIVL